MGYIWLERHLFS